MSTSSARRAGDDTEDDALFARFSGTLLGPLGHICARGDGTAVRRGT
jgi:hypothetical protein